MATAGRRDEAAEAGTSQIPQQLDLILSFVPYFVIFLIFFMPIPYLIRAFPRVPHLIAVCIDLPKEASVSRVVA
jgi:hypothetical protein